MMTKFSRIVQMGILNTFVVFDETSPVGGATKCLIIAAPTEICSEGSNNRKGGSGCIWQFVTDASDSLQLPHAISYEIAKFSSLFCIPYTRYI